MEPLAGKFDIENLRSVVARSRGFRIDSRFVKKCEKSTVDMAKTVSRVSEYPRAHARENTHLNPIRCVAGKVIHGYPISCGVGFQSLHDRLIYTSVALSERPQRSRNSIVTTKLSRDALARVGSSSRILIRASARMTTLTELRNESVRSTRQRDDFSLRKFLSAKNHAIVSQREEPYASALSEKI